MINYARQLIGKCRSLSEGIASTKPLNPDGMGVDSSAALPVATSSGRSTHIAEPDITLD
jgi:hypothetical protein